METAPTCDPKLSEVCSSIRLIKGNVENTLANIREGTDALEP